MERTDRGQTRSVRSNSQVSSANSLISDSPEFRPNALEDDADDDVRMAIAALGIMKYSQPVEAHNESIVASSVQLDPSRSTSSFSTTSGWSHSGTRASTRATSPAGPASIAARSEAGELETETDPNFISRVSQLPLVSGGLEWYERSKASSRVVKYGAGLVESSLSSISRPLANNLQLGQLDGFACRQLDRLGATSPGENAHKTNSPNFRRDILDTSAPSAEAARSRSTHDFMAAEKLSEESSPRHQSQQQAVAVVSRSRWQTVLLEAGGLGAAVSEESLKSLRYCLQWLLYATAHLDHQITVLRDFIASLHRHHPADSRSNALVTASASAHLTQIKCDVVDTIRKVVDVVSKYAGAALPDQAKKYVRQSILGLPVKWASAIEGGARRGRSVSVASTVDDGERMGAHQGSEQASTSAASPPGVASNPVLAPTEDAAERVLTFAVESLEMLKSVTQIFGDSVEKAEAWIERLRIVGLDRQRERRAAQNSAHHDSPPSPPDSYAVPGVKRRRGPLPVDTILASGRMAEDEGLSRRKRRGSEREGFEFEHES